MKKITYNKLIRDNIPARIENSGGVGSYRKLNGKEFEKKLIQKVEEEASGLTAAKSKQELTYELADVIEVIEEIKKVKKISNKQIATARQKNMKKKGGFKKRIFLRWTSDTGYRTNEKCYKK